MAKEPVRNAALAAGGGFVGLAAFKAALALGAPLGGASWGGVHEGRLPWGLRIVSGVAVGFHVLAALIVLRRGGYRVVPLPGASSVGDMGARRPAVGGGGPELRLVEQVGALRVGTRDADPGGPVPLRRAQGRAGF